MKESEIQTEITDYLDFLNIKWTKTVSNTRAGDPDLICCWKVELSKNYLVGLYLGIEVKAEGEKPTELQQEKLEDIHNSGGIAMYADCLEDVVSCLDQIAKGIFTHPRLYANWDFKKTKPTLVIEL